MKIKDLQSYNKRSLTYIDKRKIKSGGFEVFLLRPHCIVGQVDPKVHITFENVAIATTTKRKHAKIVIFCFQFKTFQRSLCSLFIRFLQEYLFAVASFDETLFIRL